MPSPGWYPDPRGAVDRYRYWDGTGWSTETAADPGGPAPSTRPAARRRRLPARTVGLLAGLLLAAAVVVSTLGEGRSTRLPSLSVSPRPTATMTPEEPAANGPCPYRSPHRAESRRPDGRVQGGTLSFSSVEGFEPTANSPELGFAEDVAAQVRRVNDDPEWLARLSVGRVRRADGFGGSPRRAAGRLLDCLTSGPVYAPYDATRIDLRGGPMMVRGRPGWLIDSRLVVEDPRLSFDGDRVVVIVLAEPGTPEAFGFFLGIVPIADESLDRALAGAVQSLRAN